VAEDRSVLVANAPLHWHPRTARLASAAPTLLAADGGANHLARLGLRPTAVIGDLDSISAETRSWLGENRMVHQPDQDRTDLEKALEYAFEEIAVDRLTVLAALGGRTDHDLGNFGLLARLAMGERLVFETEEQQVLAVAGKADLAAMPGETWSFWTFDPSVRVTVEGVRWPLVDVEICAGTTLTISNEAVSDQVHIRARGGPVLVFRRTTEN
jgi:thiamine pyrophosphokinase